MFYSFSRQKDFAVDQIFKFVRNPEVYLKLY